MRLGAAHFGIIFEPGAWCQAIYSCRLLRMRRLTLHVPPSPSTSDVNGYSDLRIDSRCLAALCTPTQTTIMATETQAQHAPTVSRSMSRYHRRPAHVPTPPPVPIPVPVPPMPETQEGQPGATLSRSKSRYHRRPTVSQAPPPMPMAPPLRSNTTPAHSEASFPTVSPAARSRTVSSPQQASHAANTAQHRPRTAKQPSAQSSPGSSSAQQHSPGADNEARQIMQKERERQRLLREKYEAEAAARREARRLEMESLEKQQIEEAEAARLKAQQEAEEAEALRRQKAEQKAEQERGKRLRKAESQKMIEQREEETRKAKLREEEMRKAKLEEKQRNAQISSPSTSPPRQDTSHGLFKRRKDESPRAEEPVPVKVSSPPRLSLGLNDREAETIRPGGKGAVLGIDAPSSAVNAGDRVCISLFVGSCVLIRYSELRSYVARNGFNYPSLPQLLLLILSKLLPPYLLNRLMFEHPLFKSSSPESTSRGHYATMNTFVMF